MSILYFGYATLLVLGLVPAAMITLGPRGAAPLTPTELTALAAAELAVGLLHAGVGWKLRGVLDIPGASKGGLLTLSIYLVGWAVCALGATLLLAGALQLAGSPWARTLQSLLTALLLGIALLVLLAIGNGVQGAIFGRR